jgi:dolichol kinase
MLCIYTNACWLLLHYYYSLTFDFNSSLGGLGRNKGWLGFLGGAMVCVPFNYRLLSLAKFAQGTIPGGRHALLVASVALGSAGALADLAVPTPALTLPHTVCGVRVPPFHVDDNFVVPIVSG